MMSINIEFLKKIEIFAELPDEELAKVGKLFRERQYKRNDIVFFVHGLMYDDTCWVAPRFNMTAAFEEEFGVDIPDEDAEQMRTVGDAIKYLVDHQDDA